MKQSSISTTEREEGDRLAPKYDDSGLITAVATNHDDGEVLMVAFMNADALERTLETGQAWFWSRSREKLWLKGEQSGAVLSVVEMRIDCDQDCVWLSVRPASQSNICHTGRQSCFYRRVVLKNGKAMLVSDDAKATNSTQTVT